jgi:isopenicillin-N epimerase
MERPVGGDPVLPGEATASRYREWVLDPTVRFLNHGSFGACPRAVLDEQQQWRERMEREPVWFLDHELEGLLDLARTELAAFLGADPDGLAFVPNATTGISTVLRSLRFEPGDELLTTSHEYNASVNALRFVAAAWGARLVVAELPFPIEDPEAAAEAVLRAVTPATRLALISHVTSPTALVLPVERIVPALAERGVDTLVDGAHAPGMVPLALDALGAAWYTGNAHKWLCAPKGSAFLWARGDRRDVIRPLAISHGANSPRHGRGRFRLEFDWPGTSDPTPYLSIPAALRTVGGMMPGGWRQVAERNHALALVARDLLCEALAVPRPAPDRMLGAMAAVPLPDGFEPAPVEPSPDAERSLPDDPLHDRLFRQHRIEVPVTGWPFTGPPDRPRLRLLRVSAQLYNELHDYEVLAAALREMLARPEAEVQAPPRHLAAAPAAAPLA